MKLRKIVALVMALMLAAMTACMQETNPLIKARKIYDYVTTVPTYSFMPPYFCVEDLPGFMATRLKGDCGVFSLLFITLCRAAGVPARWQSGLYTTPMEIGCHD